MSHRRLPVYILLDTSGSMKGEPICAVDVGLRAMLSSLRQNPYALETVHLSIITFDIEAREFMPLTPIDKAVLPEVKVPESGATFLGAALALLGGLVDRDLRLNSEDRKGDWRPLLFVMTDGSPSDLQLYRQMIPEIKRRNFSRIVACAAGPKAKTEVLLELTPDVYSLDTMDSASFGTFFQWLTASVTMASDAGSLAQSSLPSPPPEFQVVH